MNPYDKIIFVAQSGTCREQMAKQIMLDFPLRNPAEIEAKGLVVQFPEPINQKAKQETEKSTKADLLDTVFKEPDKALLLALLLLLRSDGADEELLMSLLYIML